jgi:hypothetical protein
MDEIEKKVKIKAVQREEKKKKGLVSRALDFSSTTP